MVDISNGMIFSEMSDWLIDGFDFGELEDCVE